MKPFFALICCVCIVVCVEGLQMRSLTRPKALHRDQSVDLYTPITAATFDFYMLVLQWDAKVTTDFFTIHGLWPENADGSYPENCPGPKFNTTVISDLISKLNIVWPSNNGKNTDFWKHEWEKHGTCSQFGERAYFLNSITLQDRYDVKAALSKARIVPSQTAKYTKSSVTSAVQSNLGANPALHCSGEKMLEVALCFNKNLGLMNCPTSLGSYFSCPNSVSFY
eukprot:Phypoly_transcript_16196.p1 GENE.Phypoly_transcript_16196~~Phypoly_transcript_16196.p1  ORF type:complete len:224 (+),score=24.43 Phypoly_transcript_16196:125-796(+)